MTATIIDTPIEGPAVWTSAGQRPEDGVVRLDAECQAEITGLAAALESDRGPVEALHPDDFPLPALARLMALVRAQLETGPGFAIIDRLPLAAMDRDTATKVYWLLVSHLGPPVAQKWTGERLYAVTDTGLKEEAGNGVRSSKTNQGQYYHTDNSFNLPPDFVALLCLQTARSGGESGLVSFQTAYNILLDEHPELLPRYFQPFYFDRQHEHPPDDARLASKPVFERAGGAVHVCFSRRLIQYGYELAGQPMDADTEAAVGHLCEILERPGMARTFQFAPGQIQIANNRRLGHRRTAFADWPEAERKRHLVRLWVRRRGGTGYFG